MLTLLAGFDKAPPATKPSGDEAEQKDDDVITNAGLCLAEVVGEAGAQCIGESGGRRRFANDAHEESLHCL